MSMTIPNELLYNNHYGHSCLIRLDSNYASALMHSVPLQRDIFRKLATIDFGRHIIMYLMNDKL